MLYFPVFSVNDMDIKIVKLNPSHIDGLESVENSCFSEPWSRKSLEDLLTCDYAVYFVAECDGEVAGYAGMYVSLDTGSINNIGVLENFRRKGIAAKLLSALVEHSRNNGITLMCLEVRISNAPAIALYEKFGFKMVAKRRNYYKKPTEDALLYNLELENNS